MVLVGAWRVEVESLSVSLIGWSIHVHLRVACKSCISYVVSPNVLRVTSHSIGVDTSSSFRICWEAVERLSCIWSLISVKKLFWGYLCNELLLFSDKVHLRWLLPSKIISMSKWEAAWLIPHKHAWLLCERIKILCIIILRHLLLHILLLRISLSYISLRLLVVCSTRRAPCVATSVVISRREHWMLLFLFLSIVWCSSLSLFIWHINKIIINNKFEINSSIFEILKSILTLSEFFLFFFCVVGLCM